MDKSREQFEEFAQREKLSLAYGDCGYVYTSTEMAWRAWQASRAAVEIELDDKVMVEDEFDKGHNCAIDYCAESIRAAGLKVKGE
ncbi:hypothetical protein ACU9GQ_002018 [Cronobacter sakazakii]|uniref:hypothetical protein n=1 Tax=Cronobacter sakazakii TaxID=28141 RepID=UPI000B4B58DC|nr:hypothetical protein [Cronobacter sakazakii]PUY58001.1 hypothetical protein CEA52_00400 [Cronobacter sakazakii]